MAPTACPSGGRSTFNYGYAPFDETVGELWPNEPHQIQLYVEVAKAVGVVAGTTPSRLLEVCCGRGGGLAYLHANLSPGETIGIDRSLAAIRHGRNGNAAIAHLHGHALQLPLREASIDLAVNVEALADVSKLPFLAEICRVLTAKRGLRRSRYDAALSGGLLYRAGRFVRADWP